MDNVQQQVVQQECKPLFPGGGFFFILCSACFYFVNYNWVYSVCFAVPAVGILWNLCDNVPRASLGHLIALPVQFFWCHLSKPVTEKLLRAVQSEIRDEKIMEGFLEFRSAMAVKEQLTVPEAIVFVIGAVVILVVVLKLATLFPEKMKLKSSMIERIVFLSRFMYQLLWAVCISSLLSIGLNWISLPGDWAYLICIFPFLFSWKTYKEAVKDVAENEKVEQRKNNPAEASEKVKSINIPDMGLDDVAGMADVKEQITLRMIQPLKNPAAARKYGIQAGGGLLLYGPPGTGKTHLAKAVAGELKIPFYAITAADIFSKYIGESEQNIREIFQSVRKHELSVLFIDELETIFRKRTDEIHETTRKIISIILQELDGIESQNAGLLLIGATNTPHLIDEAFLRTGRFDVQIFVGLPDLAARRQIISANFADVDYPIESGLFDVLSAQTEHFSGADLKGLVLKIKQKAFAVNAKKYDLALARSCLESTQPSANAELMQHIRRWEAGRDGQS